LLLVVNGHAEADSAKMGPWSKWIAGFATLSLQAAFGKCGLPMSE